MQYDDPETYGRQPSQGMARAALFFSLLACGISTAVLFLTYKDGKLVKNAKLLSDETSKMLTEAKKKFGEADEGGLKWDRVKERLDRIETMIKGKDERAAYYIDVLEKDLSTMREMTSEKTSGAVGKTVEGLRDARERLGTNTAEAATRIKKLSQELAPKVRSALSDNAKDDSAPAPSK